MIKLISDEYGLHPDSFIKINDNVYKVIINRKYYILKKVESSHLEMIYQRLEYSKCISFLLPLKSKYSYLAEKEGFYYALFPYYENDTLNNVDLKISFYIKSLINLHKNNKIEIFENDNFLESTLNYLDNKIKILSDSINTRIEVIENNIYQRPNDYYFFMNYYLFIDALDNASKYVSNFEDDLKKQKEIRLSLTYQNFSLDHIFLKHEKIISNEKMGYNFISCDLYDFISKYMNSNVVSQIKEYLKLNPLLDYEKDYLFALLYVFDYKRYDNNLNDLEHLISVVNYLKIVKSLEEVIFSSEDLK